MNNIHNLTIVIVTYMTDEKILKDCLDSSKFNFFFLFVNILNFSYISYSCFII